MDDSSSGTSEVPSSLPDTSLPSSPDQLSLPSDDSLYQQLSDNLNPHPPSEADSLESGAQTDHTQDNVQADLNLDLQDLTKLFIRQQVAVGVTQREILADLANIGIQMSRSTLTRRMTDWGISSRVSRRMSATEKDTCIQLLKHFYSLRYDKIEALLDIQAAQHLPIKMWHFRLWYSETGLHWGQDDIQRGVVNPYKLAAVVAHEINGDKRDAGYRNLRQALVVEHSVKINRATISQLQQ